MSESKSPSTRKTDSGRIQAFLNRYQGRYRSLRLTSGFSIAGLILLIPLPMVCVLDRFVNLTDSTRILMWTFYMIAAVLSLGFLILKRVLEKHSDLDVAFTLGDQVPELHQNVASSLQFSPDQKPKDVGVSTGLIEEARREAEDGIKNLKLSGLLPLKRTRKLAFFCCLVIGLQFLLCMVPGLEYPSLVVRFLNPFGNYDRVSGVHFKVTPGSVDAGDGETVKVDVKITDESLTRLGLYRGGEGMKPQRFEMTRIKAGHFKFTLPNLRNDLTYYIAEGNHQSRTYFVRVRRRPRIESFTFDCQYPSYTKLSAVHLEKGEGNFSALKGSRVQIKVRMDIPVKKLALLDLSNPENPVEMEMKIKGQEGTLDLKFEKSIDFQILAVSSALEQENIDRLTYTLESIPDKAPVVKIKEPGRLVRRDISEQQKVQFDIKDEFPIQEVRLVIKRKGQEDLVRKINPEGIGENMLQGRTTLSLAEHRISFQVEARDLLDQWGSGQPHTIIIPVASGDQNSADLAAKFGIIKKGFVGVRNQLKKTHGSFSKILGLLKQRPPKWSAKLESVFAELRPAMEGLQQKASHATGLCIQQKGMIRDFSALEGLAPVEALALDLERAVKGIDIKQALIDIRQDFKGLGPISAREIVKQLSPWVDPVAKAASYLTVYEPMLWLRDYRMKSWQLVAAEQSILIEGASGSAAVERLLPRQKMILEEMNRVIDSMEKIPGVPPKSRNRGRRGKKISANPYPIFAQVQKQGDLFQKNIKAEKRLSMDRAVKFVPWLKRLDQQYNTWLVGHEASVVRYREDLKNIISGKVSLSVQLKNLETLQNPGKQTGNLPEIPVGGNRIENR